MKNLLSFILLIISLPSFFTSAENFTLSFPQDLAVGSNSSNLAKRDERLFLHGGMKVKGISWFENIPYERDCTLSFPVVHKDGEKGFLTSYLCSSGDGDIFVGEVVVGSANWPFNLLTDSGLDYAFVKIYNDYWSDEISRKIDYSHCSSTGRGIVDVDEPLPIIPTPNQPLSVRDKVYAHGGGSGMVQGVILELDVKIRTIRMGGGTEPPFYLYDVTKIQMNRKYLPGDLGTPVYTPLPVPDSNQIIASPVGQVVEAVGDSSQENVWYYIPLDRILKDSELRIASGDLSYLLPPEPNNKELAELNNNVSPSDNSAIESNVSEINLVSRQPGHQVLLTHAGVKMWVSANLVSRDENAAKKCTLGFAIRKIRGNDQFDHGFLTLASCAHSNNLVVRPKTGIVFYAHPPLEPIPGEGPKVTFGTIGRFQYNRLLGRNFAIVELHPNDAFHTFWDDNISADMPVTRGYADVIARQFVPDIGHEVCWWGGYSEHLCGTVVDTRAILTILNPWRWPIYVRVVIPLIIDGIPIPLELQWDPEENFRDLIKVRVNGIPRGYSDLDETDRGAPVYYPYYNGHGRGRQIVQVKPVGILFGYNPEESADRSRCEFYMYCVSMEKILFSLGDEYELIGENG
jgi:hypothetical protein